MLTRSASLPHSGVDAVIASSAAVTTQVYALWPPPRSWMISGSALETMVEDRIAANMPSSSPDSASMICRCVMGASPEPPECLA